MGGCGISAEPKPAARYQPISSIRTAPEDLEEKEASALSFRVCGCYYFALTLDSQQSKHFQKCAFLGTSRSLDKSQHYLPALMAGN